MARASGASSRSTPAPTWLLPSWTASAAWSSPMSSSPSGATRAFRWFWAPLSKRRSPLLRRVRCSTNGSSLDRHQRQPDRAGEDPDRARSLGSALADAGRAGGPGQRRRFGVGPAGHVPRPGRRRQPERLPVGRHVDHRHGGHGRLADLLRLRPVRRDVLHDRRHGRDEEQRRRPGEPGHEARQQRVSRFGPVLQHPSATATSAAG